MFTRKPRLQLEKFAINGAKRLLQHNRPLAAVSRCSNMRVQKPGLLDHLVGAGEERWRHFEAECLGGFEIDRELVLGRCLHWQAGGLFALEDAIDIPGGAAEIGRAGLARTR